MMRRIARILLVAIFAVLLGAGAIAPYGYDHQFREDVSAAPSRAHWLGTDAIGRDRWSRLLYGGRISIVLAPAAALVSVAAALVVGLAAAAAGGWWERAAAAAIDLFLSLPWLFLLLAVRGLLPLNASPAASVAVTFAMLGLLGWPGPARVVLTAARRQLAGDYVTLARASGAGAWRVAAVHILPNLAPVAGAQFWTTAPAFLLAEANLSLLGLGIAEPLPSWGNLLRELQSTSALAHSPWMLVPLGLLVAALSCCEIGCGRREYGV